MRMVYIFTYSFLLSNQRYLLSDAEPKTRTRVCLYVYLSVCKHWSKCVLKRDKKMLLLPDPGPPQRRAKERKEEGKTERAS